MVSGARDPEETPERRLRRGEHEPRPPARMPWRARVTIGAASLLTLGVYYAVLAVLAVYGFHRALMIHLFYRHRTSPPRPAGPLPSWPRVTVQLPIYNEVYVVERLIEAAAALDYPKDRLEIQILDDSTDETRELARGVAERLR